MTFDAEKFAEHMRAIFPSLTFNQQLQVLNALHVAGLGDAVLDVAKAIDDRIKAKKTQAAAPQVLADGTQCRPVFKQVPSGSSARDEFNAAYWRLFALWGQLPDEEKAKMTTAERDGMQGICRMHETTVMDKIAGRDHARPQKMDLLPSNHPIIRAAHIAESKHLEWRIIKNSAAKCLGLGPPAIELVFRCGSCGAKSEVMLTAHMLPDPLTAASFSKLFDKLRMQESRRHINNDPKPRDKYGRFCAEPMGCVAKTENTSEPPPGPQPESWRDRPQLL